MEQPDLFTKKLSDHNKLVIQSSIMELAKWNDTEESPHIQHAVQEYMMQLTELLIQNGEE